MIMTLLLIKIDTTIFVVGFSFESTWRLMPVGETVSGEKDIYYCKMVFIDGRFEKFR